MGNKGVFAGGMATGVKGGMALAKHFNDMMARYHVDQAAKAKIERIDAQDRDSLKVADANAGKTDAPLTAAVETYPAMAGAEVSPVQAPEVEQKGLDSAPAVDSGTFSPDQWNSTPSVPDASALQPATAAPSFDIQGFSAGS